MSLDTRSYAGAQDHKEAMMNSTIEARVKRMPRFGEGLVGGLFGGVTFLPVMILLQPTIWAQLVFAFLPGIPQLLGEFLGWLAHISVLGVWSGLFAILFNQASPKQTLLASTGWAFLIGWFTVMIITLVNQAPIPLLGWILETIAHGLYGAIFGGVLLYFWRPKAR